MPVRPYVLCHLCYARKPKLAHHNERYWISKLNTPNWNFIYSSSNTNKRHERRSLLITTYDRDVTGGTQGGEDDWSGILTNIQKELMVKQLLKVKLYFDRTICWHATSNQLQSKWFLICQLLSNNPRLSVARDARLIAETICSCYTILALVSKYCLTH